MHLKCRSQAACASQGSSRRWPRSRHAPPATPFADVPTSLCPFTLPRLAVTLQRPGSNLLLPRQLHLKLQLERLGSRRWRWCRCACRRRRSTRQLGRLEGRGGQAAALAAARPLLLHGRGRRGRVPLRVGPIHRLPPLLHVQRWHRRTGRLGRLALWGCSRGGGRTCRGVVVVSGLAGNPMARCSECGAPAPGNHAPSAAACCAATGEPASLSLTAGAAAGGCWPAAAGSEAAPGAAPMPGCTGEKSWPCAAGGNWSTAQAPVSHGAARASLMAGPSPDTASAAGGPRWGEGMVSLQQRQAVACRSLPTPKTHRR